MFKRILIPVDLAAVHEPAVRMAAKLAQTNNGSITLLHVVELIPGLPQEEERLFYQRLEKQAQVHLAKLAKIAAESKASCSAEVVVGHPLKEIVEYAEKNAMDLIVLTSHRVKLENPVIGWGTLSYKIGILSQCPVLLVK